LGGPPKPAPSPSTPGSAFGLPPLPEAAPSAAPLTVEQIASKSRALDEFMAAMLQDRSLSEKIKGKIKNEAWREVALDPRITKEDKNKLDELLAATVDLQAIQDKERLLFDSTFSEQELRFLSVFLVSPINQKILKMQKAQSNLIEAEISQALKDNFEKVTHLPRLAPREPEPPGWFTQLIWRWVPSTRCR
jgi:hypothetical protein